MVRAACLVVALLTSAFAFAAASFASGPAPLRIVAAENFYGDVAKQIGGADVSVFSILSNPDQDPHLFEASVSTGKALNQAKIVVASGADYDPWMDKLLSATKAPGRAVIVVADLVGKKAGDNPHIWYDTNTMKAYAARLTALLETFDPARKAAFAARERTFLASLQSIDGRIADMRSRFQSEPVAASEPVFGYMAQRLGLDMRDGAFQLAVMNDVEPSVSEVAGFENDLSGRKVKALVYNSQATEPLVQKLVDLAKRKDIPIVGVTETEPPGATYQAWMTRQLAALDAALSHQSGH